MASWSIIVKPTGRTFGVFGRRDGAEDELIEGGFFSERAAETSREQWEAVCVDDEVEAAERRAGWDPNP